MAFCKLSKEERGIPISDEPINQLLAGGHSREDILGKGGLLNELTKKVAERALEAEMETHLRLCKA